MFETVPLYAICVLLLLQKYLLWFYIEIFDLNFSAKLKIT